MAIPILGKCEECSGTGIVVRSTPINPDQPVTCPRCNGETQVESGFIPDVDVAISNVLAKCEEIKTKQNNMHADINQIKARVDQIWDKVK